MRVGDKDLRAENVSKAVKGFALKKFKMMTPLLKVKSNAWTETYYRENKAELTPAGETFKIKGVPRLAAFPHVSVDYTKHSATHIKFAAEDVISMEDKLTDDIPVQARSMLRVARSITNDIDLFIYTELSATTGINTAAASATWNNPTESNRNPITDILTGIRFIQVDNYDPLENGYLMVNLLDYQNLLINSKVINNPSFKTADVVSNGIVGQLCGLNIIVSSSVADDEFMIIVGNQAATWQEVVPLTSAVIEDKGIKFNIRSWQIGHLQVTDPEAIFVGTNTQQ